MKLEHIRIRAARKFFAEVKQITAISLVFNPKVFAIFIPLQKYLNGKD